MKLFNEKSVLIYHIQSDKLELREMIDTCNFAEIYLNQSKIDEFFLNFREKLLIVLSNLVFEYDSRTNMISEVPGLNEDHKGGNLIYVPSKNSIYCISGLSTSLTEVLVLDKKFHYPLVIGWSEVNKLHKARGYYSVYLQNESIVYAVLGFNLFSGQYLPNIEKFDTSKDKQEWTLINLSSQKLFFLSFAAVMPITDHEIYLIGGKDHLNNDNLTILCINLKRFNIEDTQMRLVMNMTGTSQSETKTLFYQESCFLPLTSPNHDLMLANFDTKNYLHLINLKTFDYTYVHRQGSDKQSSVNVTENNSDSSSERN
jgi:hypothetical protein